MAQTNTSSGPKKLSQVTRPRKMPISADWPEEIYTSLESIWSLTIGGHEFHLSELSLEIHEPDLDGPLRIAIKWDTGEIEIDLELNGNEENPDYRFSLRSDSDVSIKRGAASYTIVEFFYEYPPVIWFADGSALEGNQLVELKHTLAPYDSSKIQVLDWTGTNIRKESQGREKDATSIQARMIRELMARDYQMIVDDDGSGEAADIVTIRVAGEFTAPERIEVELYHLKFSLSSHPGARIKDLYEVCGQAQKSIFWLSSSEKRTDLFTHLMRREAKRRNANRVSRYEKGDAALIETIREISQVAPVVFKVFVVQPGVSKAGISREQLELMSVTETYLAETYQLEFQVITSA